MAIYPVFAQYKPPVRCENIFDTTPEYRYKLYYIIRYKSHHSWSMSRGSLVKRQIKFSYIR